MDAGLSPARQPRVHRHELRSLTYVTVDDANGGVVRNLSSQGIGAQMIAALRPQQELRLRFELNLPRLRVETRGQVTWASKSGECGIRFVELTPKTARQINEWIFASLLEETALHSEWDGSNFAQSQPGKSMFGPQKSGVAAVVPAPSARPNPGSDNENDGLMVSSGKVQVIEMPIRPDPLPFLRRAAAAQPIAPRVSDFDWLFQPLSGRALIWSVNVLVVIAALLLFGLVFLSVTGESPRWPLLIAGAAAMFVAGLYWGFFRLFGGMSPGARLARLAGSDLKEEEARDARFR